MSRRKDEQTMTVYGYETKTTFWQDFSIADMFGAKAIKSTYKQSLKAWKHSTEYITELVMVLNWKMWFHAEHRNDTLSRLYQQLWEEADGWCLDHLKGNDLIYYIRTTD